MAALGKKQSILFTPIMFGCFTFTSGASLPKFGTSSPGLKALRGPPSMVDMVGNANCCVYNPSADICHSFRTTISRTWSPDSTGKSFFAPGDRTHPEPFEPSLISSTQLRQARKKSY